MTSMTNADETLTNADESLNESPYAFLTEHFSLCSFYSLAELWLRGVTGGGLQPPK